VNKRQFTNKYIRERIGARPSGWDVRSASYQPPVVTKEIAPKEFDFLDYAPTNIRSDQGNIGSCVGWDFSMILESLMAILEMKTLVWYTGVSSVSNTLSWVDTDVSAGWAYHWSRKYSNPPVPEWVEGSTNFGAAKALNKVGFAFESEVPTDVTAPWDGIEYNDTVKKEAMKRAIASYHNIPNDPETIAATMYGLTFELPYKMPDGSHGKAPIASAFPVYNTFKDAYDDGVVPMPEPGDSLLGGHSSPLYGKKVIDGMEYYINYGSWGKDIGDEGKFYIPVDYPFYPNDFYLIVLRGQVVENPTVCISEKSNRLLPVLNWMDTSENRFYYGKEVAGGEI
jgi:hypothetical protein